MLSLRRETTAFVFLLASWTTGAADNCFVAWSSPVIPETKAEFSLTPGGNAKLTLYGFYTQDPEQFDLAGMDFGGKLAFDGRRNVIRGKGIYDVKVFLLPLTKSWSVRFVSKTTHNKGGVDRTIEREVFGNIFCENLKP